VTGECEKLSHKLLRVWKFVNINIRSLPFVKLDHGLFVIRQSTCVPWSAGCHTCCRLLLICVKSEVKCSFCVYILFLVLRDKISISQHFCVKTFNFF
jgi:hypothetical protein